MPCLYCQTSAKMRAAGDTIIMTYINTQHLAGRRRNLKCQSGRKQNYRQLSFLHCFNHLMGTLEVNIFSKGGSHTDIVVMRKILKSIGDGLRVRNRINVMGQYGRPS